MLSSTRVVPLFDDAADTKIGNKRSLVPPDQDIFRLDIAMKDTVTVKIVQTGANLKHVVNHVVDRQWITGSFSTEFGNWAVLDVLHDQMTLLFFLILNDGVQANQVFVTKSLHQGNFALGSGCDSFDL